MTSSDSAPCVTGMSAYLPKKIRTAAEVDSWIGAPEGWTKQKTGVELRHVAADNETVATMGAAVVKQLLAEQQVTLANVDAIISASGCKDQFLPATATLIAHELGTVANGIPAFDIDATCMSHVLALDMMARVMQTGMYQRVIVVTSELPSRGLDPKDKESAALFGDAAIASLLEVNQFRIEQVPAITKITHSKFATFPEGVHYTEVQVGSSYPPALDTNDYDTSAFRFSMNGAKIYEIASKVFPSFLGEFLSSAGYSLQDFDYIVPHQASKPAVELLARKLNAPRNKVARDYERFGNTIAASIPLSLLMACKEGRVSPGDTVLLTGTAAGLTLGAMIVQI